MGPQCTFPVLDTGAGGLPGFTADFPCAGHTGADGLPSFTAGLGNFYCTPGCAGPRKLGREQGVLEIGSFQPWC